MNLGATELILILVVVLILFGPSKLPGLGKSIGEAIRGFKKGMHEDHNEKPAQIVREENGSLNNSDANSSEKQANKEKHKS